jgi:hypothetical protein
MSSFEALTEALGMLEGEAVAARLRAVHEALVQQQLAQRGYVGSHR